MSVIPSPGRRPPRTFSPPVFQPSSVPGQAGDHNSTAHNFTSAGDASRGAEGPARRSPGNLLQTRKVPLPASPPRRGKMRRAVDDRGATSPTPSPEVATAMTDQTLD